VGRITRRNILSRIWFKKATSLKYFWVLISCPILIKWECFWYHFLINPELDNLNKGLSRNTIKQKLFIWHDTKDNKCHLKVSLWNKTKERERERLHFPPTFSFFVFSLFQAFRRVKVNNNFFQGEILHTRSLWFDLIHM
jgi:hypothetical protein